MPTTIGKMTSASLLAGLLAALLPAPLWAQDEGRPPNTLTEREQQRGWKLLFDGRTTNGWRAYRGQGIPDVWKVRGGALVCSPKNGTHGGDIITLERYGSFELAIEWKVSVGANSGVMYRVSESEEEPWMTGPEYQILDNERHSDGRNAKTSAASCYGLFAPSEDRTKPVGKWNQARIVVVGSHVEHWLNGFKVLEYELGSERWQRHVEDSKFRAFPKFGKVRRGHIDLQFHGDEVWFRNIRIRPEGRDD
jgi:hypothetical protein